MPAALKRKGKVFYIEGTIRVGDNSVRIRETTGCHDEESARVVFNKRCAEIERQLLLGEFPLAAKRGPGFATAAADYMDAKSKSERPLGKQDRQKLLRLAEFFGEKPVDQIEAEDWDDFVAEVLDDAAPATVRRWYAMFSPPLLRTATKFRFILPDFDVPSEGPPREIFLEREDRDGLLAAYSEHARPVALLLCMQGCRHFEALRLQWPDVSFQRNTLTFRVTKNGEARVVPMHPEVRAMLLSKYEGQANGAVFLTPDGTAYTDRRQASHGDGTDGSGIRRAHATALRRYTIKKLMKRQATCTHCRRLLVDDPGHPNSATVQRAIIRPAGVREELADYTLACKACDDARGSADAAKINWFRLHDWRHHWASWFIMDGGDAPSLMALGGWKNPKMVQRYVKLDVTHLSAKLAQTQRRGKG